jgi:hypothetical protein
MGWWVGDYWDHPQQMTAVRGEGSGGTKGQAKGGGW